MRAGLSGVFVDREIRRGGKGRRDTAQPEAALAVSSQIEATSARRRFCQFALLSQSSCLLPPHLEAQYRQLACDTPATATPDRTEHAGDHK